MPVLSHLGASVYRHSAGSMGTDVHQHGFAGAFAVAEAASLHVPYPFDLAQTTSRTVSRLRERSQDGLPPPGVSVHTEIREIPRSVFARLGALHHVLTTQRGLTPAGEMVIALPPHR
jgi:hypothetical protein